MDENGWTTAALRDQRYDCVVHLVSAADGAEEFYTTHDGSVRSEPPQLVRGGRFASLSLHDDLSSSPC